MSIQPLPAERRPRPRIETLADLVFGLSLSIGAIGLIASAPTTQSEINSHIYAFGFTFLVLITAWIIYTTYMSVLPGEVRAITFLNAALLLLVALIPYLLNSVELANPSLNPAEVSAIGNYASTLFALDLTNHADPGGLRARHQHRREESRRAGTGSTLPQREEPLGDPIARDRGFDR